MGWTRNFAFKRCKTFLPNIVISNVQSGTEVQSLALSLEFSAEVTDFVFGQLELTHQHEDYCELLELTLMLFERVRP